MSEEAKPYGEETPGGITLSYERTLKLLGFLVLIGTLGSTLLVSLKFGAGVLLGGLFSVLNYYWLRSILRKSFEKSGKSGSTARMALKFILRYFVFAAVLLIVFLTGIVPVIAVLFGLAGFALAVMVEGILSVFKPVGI